MKSLGVFCSARSDIEPKFEELAKKSAIKIAQRKWRLVFGGSDCGLMSVLCHTAKKEGAEVIGVIPQSLQDRNLGFKEADELIVTRHLGERKEEMIAKSDAFLILPGGFGTLDELLEVLTWRQLGYHQKKTVILNLDGFYDPLLSQFDRIFTMKFAPKPLKEMYVVAKTVDEAFERLDQN